MRARIIFHCAAVVVLLGSLASAQSKPKAQQSSQEQPAAQNQPSASSREASSGMATGRRSGSIIVHDTESSNVQAPREASSGMATGRRQHEPITVTAREAGSGMATGRKSGSVVYMDRDATDATAASQPEANARNSAHATESLKSDSKLSNAQSNPLYKDSGMQGTNPMYQQKDKTAAPASSGAPATPQAYKDGEDGTSHTRPGNHKPSK